MAGERLEIRTLGGLLILRDSQYVHFQQRKAAAILVYLAYTGLPHARETLAEMLWPGRMQGYALRNLRVALSDLRRSVDPYVLCARDVLAFNQSMDWKLDALDFASLLDSAGQIPLILEAALRLYRGSFLDGFNVQSPGFEQWMILEREHLHWRAVIALQTLTEQALQSGQYDLAMTYATRLLRLDSLDENGHRALMRALVLSGQRSAALTHYEDFCRLLAGEMDAEPGAELTALYCAILADRLPG